MKKASPMKKSAIVLLAIAGVVVTIYSQRAEIAERLIEKGLATAMTTDATAGLTDGLHVALCGAGGPMPDPSRAGPCVAVVAGKHLFVVDAGTGGVRNLLRMRYPVGRIEALLLTHFHSDHIDGLGELATLRWIQGSNTQPLPVFGPEGLEQVIHGFDAAYAQDAVYRNAHHGDKIVPLSGHGLAPQSFTAPSDGELVTVFAADGVLIQMLAVDHAPIKPAVGYLFSYKGRTALISGDTTKSANLEHFANGVDLLVHEALAPKLVGLMHNAAAKTGNQGMAQITTDILNYHASPVEAAEIARDAGAGHLLYYHIVPPLVLPGAQTAWLEGVDDVFPANTLGQDGTAFSLPAGSKEIIQTGNGI
jgi:ribonuclease Z